MILRAICLAALVSACGEPAKDADPPVDTAVPDDTAVPEDTGASTTPVVRDPRFDGVVGVLEAELAGNFAAGVSIAVLEQGVFTWVEGFGTADPQADVPMTPDHVLQIGSTTKQMTAARVLQQAEAGLLDLDDPLTEALPLFSLAANPDWTANATIHDLLSHQGGLYDYIDPQNGPDDELLASWYYGFFADNLWAMNPPGAFWNYANPNFSLAGLIAEVHDPSGRPYADQVAEELFAPLGMTSTFPRKAAVVATGRHALSTGVDLGTGSIGDIPMAQVPDPSPERPAGFVWSTPSDMCRWGRFVIGGDGAVLGDASRQRITTPQVATGYFGDHHTYGYGQFLWDLYPLSDGFYPIRVWEHGGNTLSFTSVLVMLPDHDVVLSILSTGYGDLWEGTTEAILRAVVDPLPPVSDYTGEPLDLDAIGDHVGSYDDPFNVGPVEISAGGQYGLQIAMPLLTSVGYDVAPDLLPASTDLWYVELDGMLLDLAFVRDEAGDTAYLRNRAFVAARAPVARRAAPSPDAAQVRAAVRAARAPAPLRLPLPRR